MLFLVACFVVGCIAYVLLSIWPVVILSTLVIVVGAILSLVHSYGWSAFLHGFVLPVVVAQAGYVVSLLAEGIIKRSLSRYRSRTKQMAARMGRKKMI